MVSVSRRAGTAAAGARRVDEALQPGQRAAALAGKGDIDRQHDRQFLFGDRHDAAVLAVDDGNRRPPVALPGDQPVAQAIVDGPRAEPSLLRDNAAMRSLPVSLSSPSKLAGVDHDAGSLAGAAVMVAGSSASPCRLDHDLQRKAVLAGELEIALVVGRHRHDRAGAVIHQDEVGQIDRHLPAGERIDSSSCR